MGTAMCVGIEVVIGVFLTIMVIGAFYQGKEPIQVTGMSTGLYKTKVCEEFSDVRVGECWLNDLGLVMYTVYDIISSKTPRDRSSNRNRRTYLKAIVEYFENTDQSPWNRNRPENNIVAASIMNFAFTDDSVACIDAIDMLAVERAARIEFNRPNSTYIQVKTKHMRLAKNEVINEWQMRSLRKPILFIRTKMFFRRLRNNLDTAAASTTV